MGQCLRLGAVLVGLASLVQGGAAQASQRMIVQVAQPAVEQISRGDSSFAVVVHPSNPVDDLSLRDLRDIFLLRRQSWPNGRRITVTLPESGATRAEVLRLICGMKEIAFQRQVAALVYRGETTGPRELRTISGLLRFVFNVPGAIAVVPTALVDSSVKVIRIDGWRPGEVDYALTSSESGVDTPW